MMDVFALHARMEVELGRPIQRRLLLQLQAQGKTEAEVRSLIIQAHKQFPHGKLDRLAPDNSQGGDSMKHVTIYTDGSCKGNPGPGGYGAILQYEDDQGRQHEKAISSGIAHTTNNRAELLAAIQSLRALKEPCLVELYTDSQYLVTVATGGQARANRSAELTTKPGPGERTAGADANASGRGPAHRRPQWSPGERAGRPAGPSLS